MTSETFGVLIFAGVLLDGNDRKTELRHIKCYDNFQSCEDYDLGVDRQGRRIELPDMPLACVELMRTAGKIDSGRAPCSGYSLSFQYDPNAEWEEDHRGGKDQSCEGGKIAFRPPVPGAKVKDYIAVCEKP
jgi:hypothetical protein